MAVDAGNTFVVREHVEALDATLVEAKSSIARDLDSALATLEERRLEFDTEAESIQREIHRNHEEFISKMHEIADRMKKSLAAATVAAVTVLLVEVALIYFTN